MGKSGISHRPTRTDPSTIFRTYGINFAHHLRAPVKQKKTEWFNGVKISLGKEEGGWTAEGT